MRSQKSRPSLAATPLPIRCFGNKKAEIPNPKLGYLYEIRLPEGRVAYCQYIHNNNSLPGYGTLVRVLPGIFREPPTDLVQVLAEKEAYSCFILVGMGVKMGYLRLAGNYSYPAELNTFPIMRSCFYVPDSNRKICFI